MRYLNFEAFKESASHEIELEYYDRVGQHGGQKVASMEEGIRKAKEFMNNPELQDGSLYYGVYDYTTEDGAIVFATQEYYDYLKDLDFTKDPNDKVTFMNALQKCIDTGEIVHYHLG